MEREQSVQHVLRVRSQGEGAASVNPSVNAHTHAHALYMPASSGLLDQARSSDLKLEPHDQYPHAPLHPHARSGVL